MKIPAAAVIGACIAAVSMAAVAVAVAVDDDSRPGHSAGMIAPPGRVMSAQTGGPNISRCPGYARPGGRGSAGDGVG